MIRYLVGCSSLLAVLVVASSVFEGTAFGDDREREPLNTITVSPLSLIFNRELDLEYERAVSDDFSLFAGPSFIVGTTSSCNCSYSGWGATAGARFFAGQAPSGVFFGVFGSVFSLSASLNGASGSAFAWEAGGMIGYTFIIARHFDLSLGLGAAYAQEQVTLSSGGSSVTVGSNGVIPALRLAVGVAF